MRENPSWQLDSGRHQKCRPVHGVKPDDVLADHVQIGRPETLETLRGGVGKPDAGEVVGQRVDPYVHDVVGMVGHRYTPVERRAGDRKVVQPTGDEADDLVAPHVGSDELRMRLVVGQQLVGVLRKPEEVRLLFDPGNRRPGFGCDARGVGADGGLGFGEEALRRAPSTSPRRSPGRCRRPGSSGARSPRTPQMVGVGGADEPVERDVELLLQSLEHIGVAPRQLRGRHAFGRRPFRPSSGRARRSRSGSARRSRRAA